MNSFLIYASWGEYDDFTTCPLFFCDDIDSATMLVDAFNNKENPYWELVVEFFVNEFGSEYTIPSDIGFNFKELNKISI